MIQQPLPQWARDILRMAARNASRRGIPFTLTQDDMRALVARADGRCVVTGIPFDFEKHRGSRRRPFAPSIDRERSTLGYRRDNCRLVCIAVNLAMNEWGLDPLLRIARALVAAHPTPDGWVYEAPRPRNQWGERGPSAKLTDAQCDEIRQRRRDGEKQVDLAREYGVSTAQVSRIVGGKSRSGAR